MAERVQLTLRLQPGTGVPRGELVVDGSARPFVGWLELLRCLEDARPAGTSHEDGGASEG
jgi:hypothetical protein